MSEDLISHGRDYILARFQEVWGVDRTDEIGAKTIAERQNLVAIEGYDVVGWLGVATHGELVNGCGGPGRSAYILIALLNHLFDLCPDRQFHAYVPVDYLASAVCCIKAGMIVPEGGPIFVRKVYDKKVITLIKLVSPIPGVKKHAGAQQELNTLKEIIKKEVSPSLLRRGVKRWTDFKKRVVDWIKQFSFITDVIACVFMSLIFYIAFLIALRHDLPKYMEFLTQKNSEKDRKELIQYLSISQDALRSINSEINNNDNLITEFVYVPTSGQSPNQMFSSEHVKSILQKQQVSMKLLSDILNAYSKDLENGNDSPEKYIILYEAVLKYMSDEKPYHCSKDPYKHFHDFCKTVASTPIGQPVPTTLNEDGARQGLERYVSTNISSK